MGSIVTTRGDTGQTSLASGFHTSRGSELFARTTARQAIRMLACVAVLGLMPCTFGFGGVLLAFCDALGRAVLAPVEVPAGAITACIGGPYLVWVVRRR